MTTPPCFGCGKERAWYDGYGSRLCRECRSNRDGKCAEIVYDKDSRDVIGHACRKKAVGFRFDKDGNMVAGWRYCKRHGGIKV